MENLKIAQKWEDMAAYAYITLRHMPKSERYTMGAEVRQSLWHGLKLISRANYVRNKMPLLYEIDMEIKSLLALIRVGHTIGVVPTKKYKELGARLVEIGKMLGGWIKSQKQSRG
jgi:hypothetical protein